MNGGKPAMRSRHAAAGVGVVDQVVVHQRRGLEELEGRTGPHDVRAVCAAGTTPAPIAERRSQPFPAAKQFGRRVRERSELGPDVGKCPPLTVEELVQFSLDARAKRSYRVGGVRRAHGPKPNGVG
jgi:hypothetical protein